MTLQASLFYELDKWPPADEVDVIERYIEPRRPPGTRMTIADLVYNQVKELPESLAREVLDFIGFLREGRDRAEWRDLMNAQATGLAAVWDNPEDKVWDDV
jgi:hypothetical protein